MCNSSAGLNKTKSSLTNTFFWFVLSTAPCQNVLDFFKTVLQHYNQFVQPQPEEQLTEVSLTENQNPLLNSYENHSDKTLCKTLLPVEHELKLLFKLWSNLGL